MLFGRHADALGFTVTSAQQPFPDCTAKYRGKRVRIEFEFESRHFETHGHDPNGCDLIVCWRHIWPNPGRKYGNAPAVLELRRYFGLGWNAWLISMESKYVDKIPGGNRYTGLFSVPSRAGPDDLILLYRPAPDRLLRDVVRVATPVERVANARWKKGPDWMAEYQRVARLEKGLALDTIAEALGVPRKQIGRHLQGRRDVTSRWPHLRRHLLEADPRIRAILKSYGPDRSSGR
jgi:hypothetical protein